MKWTFNFDAAWGTFGFGNSFYTDVRPDPTGNLSGSRATSSRRYRPASHWEEANFTARAVVLANEPTEGPDSIKRERLLFTQEDLYIVWHSGRSLGSSENLLDFTVGCAPYTIGHGFLVWDVTGEGGAAADSGVMLAWKYATIARLKPKNHTIEGGDRDPNDVSENQTGTPLWQA